MQNPIALIVSSLLALLVRRFISRGKQQSTIPSFQSMIISRMASKEKRERPTALFILQLKWTPFVRLARFFFSLLRHIMFLI
jgi:hypothetical protein